MYSLSTWPQRPSATGLQTYSTCYYIGVRACVPFFHVFLLCPGKQESIYLWMSEWVSAFQYCHTIASIQIWTQLRTGVLGSLQEQECRTSTMLSLSHTHTTLAAFHLWNLWLLLASSAMLSKRSHVLPPMSLFNSSQLIPAPMAF